jgi:NADH-quinone oxidoreductase subunit J
MELFEIAFYVFALVTLGSAAVVVFSRNIMYSAFGLLFTFFGVAGLYVILHADFLAITQLLIYVGGILVLILFGVMLTHRVINVEMKTGALQTVPSAVVAAVLAGSLSGVFYSTWGKIEAPQVSSQATSPVIGEMLMTSYLLPFEVASVVLLVALLGAALIARRKT